LFGSETHPEFGTRTVLSYDEMNRLREVSGIGGTNNSAATQRQNFTYTTNGWLSSETNVDNHWAYGYDDDGLLNTATLSSGQESFTLGYQNNAEGYLKRISYPGGTELSYTYNVHGQPKSALPYIENVSYTVDGLPETVRYGDGSLRFLTYTHLNQMNTLSVSNDGDQILSLDYDYTERGNLDELTGFAGVEYPVSLDLSNLQYDGLSRLTRADGAWGIGQYSYDSLGNIKTKNVGGQNVSMQYDGVNRLNRADINDNGLVSTRHYQYDDYGNIISDSINDYRFDHLNRLIESTSPGSQSNQNVVQVNSYDTNGHRTRITVDDGVREETTHFVYSPSGDLMHEYDPATGERRDHVHFMNKRVATLITHNRHDSDGDGLPDYFERINGLSVHASGDQHDDPDGDGVSNLLEYQNGLSILDSDSDNDGVPDFVAGSSNPVASVDDSYMPAVLFILQ